MVEFKIECPNCQSPNTEVVLETAYDRQCLECCMTFDIRPQELIEDDLKY